MKRTRYTEHGTQHRFGHRALRLGGVALLLVVVAMALLPLTSTPAGAIDNRDIDEPIILAEPRISVDGPVLVDVIADPTETPNPEPELNPDIPLDDLPVAQPEDIPTLVPPVAAATVYVNKFGCTDDYDGDYYQLAANCVPMEVPFTVGDSTGGYQEFNGSFEATVANGFGTIAEALPEGYADPIVFCKITNAAGLEGDYYLADALGGWINFDVAPCDYFYCDWYNVPVEGDGTIHINKHLCPVGFDAYAADYYDLAANCHEDGNGFDFELLVGGDVVVDSGTTGDVEDHAVVFDGLLPGNYTVSEQLPAGYGASIVFCKYFSYAEGIEGEYFQPELSGASVPAAIDAGNFLFCDWFNVPAGDGSITIIKRVCPVGYDAYAADPADLHAICLGDGNGFGFSLFNADTLVDDEMTGAVLDQAVEFDGLFPGEYAVVEDLPAGYDTPIVVCAFALEPSADDWFVADVYDGTTIKGELGENKHLRCYWYNIPTGHGTITITKWICPDEHVLIEQKVESYLEWCTEAGEGFDFTLDPAGETKSTAADGTVAFDDVAPGNITITETIPAGYGDPVVFCGWGAILWHNGGLIAIDGKVLPGDVEGGVLHHEFLAGEGMHCDWFNIPGEYDSDITIYKYTCPLGYDFDAPGADPQADCTESTNGVEFEFVTGEYSWPYQATGDLIPGAVIWSELDPATYTVKEILPAGTVDTFVTCQWIEALGPYKYESIDPIVTTEGVGDVIHLDLIEGERIVCQWYNAPEHDGGDLTVIKYWCNGHVYTVEACQLYGGGADFSLQAASGEGDPTFFSTGATGKATLHLPAASWTLKELGRDWCKAESDDVDAYGNLVTYDGYESVVIVYNCGPGGEKEPPVTKFPNTGAGSAALAAADQGGDTLLVALAAIGQVLLLATGRATGLTALVATTIRGR